MSTRENLPKVKGGPVLPWCRDLSGAGNDEVPVDEVLEEAGQNKKSGRIVMFCFFDSQVAECIGFLIAIIYSFGYGCLGSSRFWGVDFHAELHGVNMFFVCFSSWYRAFGDSSSSEVLLDKNLISNLDIVQVNLKMTRMGWLNFSHPREHFILWWRYEKVWDDERQGRCVKYCWHHDNHET